MVSIRLLSLPSDIAKYAKNNGWLSVLIMGLVSLVLGYLFYWLGNRYEGFNFSQICKILFGNFISRIILVGISIYTIVAVGLGVRLFAEGIKIFLLDRTPILMVISIMLLACLYCILKGIKTISIVLDILLIPILFLVLLLVILSLTNIKSGNILPVLHEGIVPVLKGSLELTDPFLTVGIIGYILPYFILSNSVKKWAFIAIGLSIGIHFVIILVCILNFGSNELNFLLFPTITLSKSIRLEAKIFERAESLFMAAWIPITFTTLLMYYLASTLNLKALFNSKVDKIIIYFQFILFIVLSLIPQNIADVFNYINLNEKMAMILYFGVVPLAAITELIRNRRKKAS